MDWLFSVSIVMGGIVVWQLWRAERSHEEPKDWRQLHKGGMDEE